MGKILGTGMSGLVGSRVRELLDDFEFVDASLETGVDILDLDKLKNFFGDNSEAEMVLHMAAFTDTKAAWEQRGDKSGLCYRLNIEGTRNICEMCQKYSKKLIYISTDFVFDGEKVEEYTEEDEPNPIEWYGQTKYEGEKLVGQLEGSVVARISYPYRAKFEPKMDIVRRVIEAFRVDKLYPFFDDQVTNLTFIDDIAAGLGKLFESDFWGVIHLTGSGSQTPYETAVEIARVFGFDEKKVARGSMEKYVASQPEGSRPWQKRLAMSNKKAFSLGIEMSDLKNGLKKMHYQLKNKL